TRRYTNAVYSWSVAYRPDWRIDSENPAFVKLESPQSQLGGLVGIHSESTTSLSLDQYADAVLENWNRVMSAQGVPVTVVTSQQRTLSDGTPVIDVVHVMGRGRQGQSRKLITLRDGQGFVIDAEAFLDSWPELTPSFQAIIDSFSLQHPSLVLAAAVALS